MKTLCAAVNASAPLLVLKRPSSMVAVTVTLCPAVTLAGQMDTATVSGPEGYWYGALRLRAA